MTDSLDIAEVARRTGLTTRALRFYEGRGLVRPLRTASGRRHYGPAELERLHQIIALKRAGLPLGDIKRLFDRKPIDLRALLGTQRDVLAAQIEMQRAALALVNTALSRIDRGESLDAATLCSLIHDGDKAMTQQNQAWQSVIDRYYTPDEQTEWKSRMADAPEFAADGHQAQWRALGQRIEAALPLDPADDAALAFVREWFALLEPFSRNATPAMWAKSRDMYADLDAWRGTADPGFSKAVWDFVTSATHAALAAGQDIGPVPAFMRATPDGG